MLRLILFSTLFTSLQSIAQVQPNNFFTGRTTGVLPHLNYGLGEDRLGGAKMGYLDSNIVVKVVDSVIGQYKIQLSANRFAYLPKVNFKRDSLVVARPYYLSNSWRVSGDSLYDYVSITLDEQLPYQSQQQIDPSKIVVDIFGVTNNTNWITQLSSAKEITNVTHEQIDNDVFRVTISLKHDRHWGYKIYYQNNRLQIRVKRPPPVASLDHLTIAIDAGHGGTNGGAGGKTTRIAEKDYTLRMAKELQRALLQQNAKVFMTREKDTTLDMPERWRMLGEQNPDLLISIHLNSASHDSVQGVSTYYRYIGFRPLSQFILSRMLETGLKEYGNVGSFNFSLSGPTEYPNCLVEVAFLSNKEDEQKILDPEFHKLVAAKIVEGIRDWLLNTSF